MTIRPFFPIAFLALALTSAQAQVQERTIRFGHVVQPGAPAALGVAKFAELVKERSGGKIRIQELGGGVLGGEAQQLSAVQGGVQDMSQISATVMAGPIREFTLLDTPFAFSKVEQADALLTGPFGQALLARLPEKGIIGLGFWEVGFRQFTNSKRPIVNVEDLKGLKLRVVPNPLFLESFAALGSNPVPMPFPELYGALESRAMDAQENPYAVVLTSKFNEVQKFLSATNHVYTASPVLISKKLWDQLSADERKIIQESVTESIIYQRKASREAAANARQELASKGMQVNDVPASTLAKMREITNPVAEKFAASLDPSLVKLYRDELSKIRAKIQ